MHGNRTKQYLHDDDDDDDDDYDDDNDNDDKNPNLTPSLRSQKIFTRDGNRWGSSQSNVKRPVSFKDC